MATPPGQQQNAGHPIYLYTTPLNNQKMFFKKPVDIIGHWAVCINGYCYELTRATNNEKQQLNIKGNHWVRCLPEDEWKRVKHEEKRGIKERDPVGYTTKLWPPETIKHIADLIWRTSLRETYIYDKNNCQVFVRLLIELVGNTEVKVNFPTFFNAKAREWGINRDKGFFFVTGGLIGFGTVIAGMSMMVTPVDPSGMAGACTAFAGGVACKATADLWAARIDKEEFIEKAQAALRTQLIEEKILV